MKKTLILLSAAALAVSGCSTGEGTVKETKINDSNTALHLLQPDYQVPYGIVSVDDIKNDLDRILAYLERETPTRVIDKTTKETITDYSKIDKNSQVDRGDFRLTSYEWGVTYAAMLAAGEATGDARYTNYTYDRFKFLAEVTPKFAEAGNMDGVLRSVINPRALDDAGAVCAAMIKANLVNSELDNRAQIENYMDFIMNKEHRLSDGTFARLRPFINAVWLDDMFMSVPAIVQMGRYTGDTRYYDEAVKQILQFSERMFVKDKGLYLHGWIESMEDHPAFHWGRANGWAILTMVEVLDVLPENYPGRDKVMAQFKAHVKGLAACQSGEGFWHQLLDRNDSYLETSATAIYVYCMAHAINKGWIDAMAYGPVVTLGWNAVSTQITEDGQVAGTCVGTGMGFDPAFYYYRPVNVYAAHGYGPVVWAGAEMIKLMQNAHPMMNDSAVQFYREAQVSPNPIFNENELSF
ncbi:MAG: glycoside hydrolase family 88 protein [Rikenellaceae bacterium]|nr:glycoside hydrolase family 88 protein [Rikenellaceae bacterium]